MTVAQNRNLTVSLSPETIRKAKVLAAQRSTSITRLLAGQVQALVEAKKHTYPPAIPL